MIKVVKHYFIIILFFIINNIIVAQIKKENLKLGVSYGIGSQNKFPFNSKDYKHEVTFYKAVIHYKILEKKRWSYEISIEPSYNIVEHQLLNKFFIKPTDGDDYLEQQALHTQNRTIKEYVLNFGFIASYNLFKNLNSYAIGSVGPMISDKGTERLATGYAFSDIFGLGLTYTIGKVELDFRYSIRHTSNLQFKTPNNGHNTTNLEFSILYKL
ncbi:acyloxyacyl hydrolase [Thalassobellus sediminis]|uniref:acyloxyacyl hydrolase n=1 Tax=Thalassobellus sediminis TaxID=3367753 RepID=UPI0037B2ABD0